MSYVTRQEMIDGYGFDAILEATDRAEPPTGQIDETILARAMEAANQLADGYLSRRYRLPLVAIPVDLQDHARAIAFLNLSRGRGEGIGKEVRAAYDDAITWLTAVSTGQILLTANIPPEVTGAGAPQFTAAARTFDQNSLRHF